MYDPSHLDELFSAIEHLGAISREDGLLADVREHHRCLVKFHEFLFGDLWSLRKFLTDPSHFIDVYALLGRSFVRGTHCVLRASLS